MGMIKLSLRFTLSVITVVAMVMIPLSVDGCVDGVQYACTNTSDCIPIGRVCDGAYDCKYADDESNCVVGNSSCINGLFFCWASYPRMPQCIRNASVCDGIYNCKSHEDEIGCNTTGQHCGTRQFQCDSGLCIPVQFICDGINDCATGVDERNCTYPPCPDPPFQCTHGLCISATLVCNGHWDCRDGSDESQQLCNNTVSCNRTTQIYCNGNRQPGTQCAYMDSYCSGAATCVSTTYSLSQCGADVCDTVRPCDTLRSRCSNLRIGYQCVCYAGYRPSQSDPNKCDDIDECTETPWVCQQLCTNIPGSYRCSCASGYIMDDSGLCGRINKTVNPYLLFGNKYYIRQMGLNGSNYDRLFPEMTFVHVFDFDWQSQKIVFADAILGTINALPFNGSSFKVIQNTSGLEGLALDWIGRKLYWTSTTLQGIYVSELNGSFVTTVFAGGSPYCRGIAVHPFSGYLYWTDWGSSPYIGRVGMDGTNMNRLITTEIFWPNGLTIDYSVDRVWWVEANLDRIEFMNLDGTGRHQLSVATLSHPYGLTVFEAQVYWTDWNFKSVNKADKYTGANQVILLTDLSLQPYDIKVIHPLRQPGGANPCGNNNGNCSHLCLIAPNGLGYTCACPQKWPLLPDQRTCLSTCSIAQFRCYINDSKCIPWFHYCNGHIDCAGGEDEPSTCPTRYCPSNQFQCKGTDNRTTICLLESSICDGRTTSCMNSEDENTTRCSNRVCEMWEFLCPSTGQCISVSYVCDGQQDCKNGEDEAPINRNCGGPQCPASYFACNNSNCVPQSWYCDVDNDCGDRSDEPTTCWTYRYNNPCQAGYKTCPTSYRCIALTSFCDGYNDCRDNSDELPENCLPCKPGDFTCNNKHCIPMRWVCDFTDDCGDRSDENVTMCQGRYRNCSEAEFRCNSSRCISLALRCDGNNDCIDDSDEWNCGTGRCGPNTFQCLSGQCIDAKMVCNGHKDCPNDTSDEMACPTRYPNGAYCTPEQFTCNNTICVDLTVVCDGVNDCGDGSDEWPSVCAEYDCASNGQFPCSRIHKCLAPQLVCNGVWNCPFGADENETLCNSTCPFGQFRCHNGNCIPNAEHCNGQDDCGDDSDETGCTEVSCTVCSQLCVPAGPNGTGYFCTCNDGYKVDPKNSRQCIDLNECDSLQNNWCPQICVNRKISFNFTYQCVCSPGFRDQHGDGRACLPNDGLKGTLLYSLGHQVRGLNMTILETFVVSSMNDPNSASDDVQSMDVDAINRIVYWVNDGSMRRAAIPQVSSQMPFVQLLRNVSSAKGIAFDWVTKNIYWTETNGVFVTNENVFMLTKTLQYNESNAFSPLSIVVNPSIGTLYFVNNYPSMPSIITMTMGGDNMATFVDHELLMPEGLSIDYNMNGRIFWADQRKGVIESIMPDGSDRTIVFGTNAANFPYKVDIFAGVVYWTTSSRNSIMSGTLGTQNVTTVLSHVTSVGPIRYSHAMRYNNFTSNACSGRSCSMCLLQPNGGTKCVCPDGTYYTNSAMTGLCNLTQPASWVPLVAPQLCSCSNNGYCILGSDNQPTCNCPQGFTGTHCESVNQFPSSPASGPSPSSPASSPSVATMIFSSVSSPTSAEISISSTTVSSSSRSRSNPRTGSPSWNRSTTQPIQPTVIEPIQSTVSGPVQSTVNDSILSAISPAVTAYNNEWDSENRTLTIALCCVLIPIFVIILIILGICAYKRHWCENCTDFGYKRHKDEFSTSGDVRYSIDRPNLQFDNTVFGDDGFAKTESSA